MRDRRSHPRKRQRVLISLEQRAEIRKRYTRQISWWRRSLIGYLFAIPLVGLGLAAVLFIPRLLSHFYFPGAPLFLSVLLVALIWGLGPALFSLLLATVALDYFYIPPNNQLDFFRADGVLQLLPFIVTGLLIAIITGQRESARMRALYAEQVALDQADELALANQELKQANELKDQFLSIASHELKTPVTTIRGQAQIALRRMSRQRELSSELESVRLTLEKIDEQTQRLNMLIDDLLDVNSIRAGRLELRLKECNLVEVCRDGVEDQRLLSGRTIHLDAPSTPLLLTADSDRLSQVIVNLLSNALKYSPAESSVEVRVSQHDHTAVIEVEDAGSGIPKHQQPRIFEPFYRTPAAQASAMHGLGLGLAICKDIVERHGGHIWYESNEGKGSTFFVELPLH